MRLVVQTCDAAGKVWRGDYVFCKFIHSDCCKIGDEKNVTGKYLVDETILWNTLTSLPWHYKWKYSVWSKYLIKMDGGLGIYSMCSACKVCASHSQEVLRQKQ